MAKLNKLVYILPKSITPPAKRAGTQIAADRRSDTLIRAVHIARTVKNAESMWLRNAIMPSGYSPLAHRFDNTNFGAHVRKMIDSVVRVAIEQEEKKKAAKLAAALRAKRAVAASKAKKTRAAKAAKLVALPPEVVVPEGEPEVVNITSTIAADYGLGSTTEYSKGYRVSATPADPIDIATFYGNTGQLVTKDFNETPTQTRSEQALKYPQYYKAVPSNVPRDEVDTYVVNMMFPLKDDTGVLLHARKKLLIPGVRSGGKGLVKDVTEARDALNRWLAITTAACSVGDAE